MASAAAAASAMPSAAKWRAATGFTCPRRVARCRPVAASQSVTSPSPCPSPSVRPSREKASSRTADGVAPQDHPLGAGLDVAQPRDAIGARRGERLAVGCEGHRRRAARQRSSAPCPWPRPRSSPRRAHWGPSCRSAPASRAPSGANTRDLSGALIPAIDRSSFLSARSQSFTVRSKPATASVRPSGASARAADALLGAGERARLRARGHGPQS